MEREWTTEEIIADMSAMSAERAAEDLPGIEQLILKLIDKATDYHVRGTTIVWSGLPSTHVPLFCRLVIQNMIYRGVIEKAYIDRPKNIIDPATGKWTHHPTEILRHTCYRRTKGIPS